MSEPKILFLDIETAPNLATVWSIWNQNIGLSQLLESGYLLCWSAKWKGSKEIMFNSTFLTTPGDVVQGIWELVNEADIIVHFNGRRFDMPTLNKEFLVHGMNPPAPYKNVDLYQTAKKRFKLVSYKMDYIAKMLGSKGKIKTDFSLWLGCMNGNPGAWKLMEKYNKRDVTELETLYNKLLPWIDNHPNMGLFKDCEKPVCTNCGSTKVHGRGTQKAKTMTYQRFQCQKCGTWLRSALADKTGRRAVLVQSLES